MKIKGIVEEELNTFFNPDLCHNGGGYHQPRYIITFDDGSVLTLDDTSCGDFGTRYTATYEHPNKPTVYATWGTMLELDDWETSFDKSHLDILKLVADATDCSIPTEWSLEIERDFKISYY